MVRLIFIVLMHCRLEEHVADFFSINLPLTILIGVHHKYINTLHDINPRTTFYSKSNKRE